MFTPRLDVHFHIKDCLCFVKSNLPEKSENTGFFVNHARSGILLALQSMNLSKGSKVGMMTYNCHTVMNAIDQAGYSPVFIDVTDDLTIDMDDLDSKKWHLSALIITHLFGIINDVQVIRNKYPDLPIIEDCAHAYGIERLFGDFAVLSINQGKFPSIGEGGILKVLNPAYQEQIEREYDVLPGYSSVDNVRLFCSMLLKGLMHRPFIYRAITLRLKKNRKETNVHQRIHPRKMSKRVEVMYEEALPTIDAQIHQKRENAEAICSCLSEMPNVQYMLFGINAFMVVAYCDDIETAKDFFLRKGVETATHFAHCIDWATEFGYRQGTCPNAEKLCKHLLMIPTYTKIKI